MTHMIYTGYVAKTQSIHSVWYNTARKAFVYTTERELLDDLLHIPDLGSLDDLLEEGNETAFALVDIHAYKRSKNIELDRPTLLHVPESLMEPFQKAWETPLFVFTEEKRDRLSLSLS